ncbi:MAG: SspB family protein [Acidibrevibacterium sp.]|uniref:SspB family protein n=1 Tax=Acidibrevibacterium sp. TaxID=2606776 RepID=UPI003D019CEE
MMEDDSESNDHETPPESLLPYDAWAEAALREVVARAIEYAERHGLPGTHHFFITFRTDQPGVEIPARLRAQYPREITIVLQHQFWDLALDRKRAQFSVGLSFGGVPSRITVPLAAISAFADPAVQFGLQFRVPEAPAETKDESTATPPPDAEPAAEPAAETPQVVQLSAFRKRPQSDAKE